MKEVIEKKKRILVTSALLYANGPMHIGHLVEYIQTDIFVRFLRLVGKDVIFCCADDTHGAPISINAEKSGMEPEQYIKKYYKLHTKDFESFKISFDSYYTTHSPENKELTLGIFNKLLKKGLIYKKGVMQLFCEHDKRFLPDRYVKGTCPKCKAKDQYGDVCEACGTTYNATELLDPRCILCGKEPVMRESEHYFFRLSNLANSLKEWLQNNKSLQKEMVNSSLSWIKAGLDDWCISRDEPYFGFKIPGEESKYFYVWMDAPIGYIASTANFARLKSMDADEVIRAYWKSTDSAVIHFIGKDIAYFHFLFWPAVLMSSGYSLPETIVVHGFLTVNGQKMSKSRGTFIEAKDFADACKNTELLRYYYASLLGTKPTDIDLSFKEFNNKINNDLIANIGNFCYRCLSFYKKNFEGCPENAYEPEIEKELKLLKEKAIKSYYSLELKKAVSYILQISAIGNKYFQDSEPWKAMKQDKERAKKAVSFCLGIVKDIAILIKPVMPGFSEKLEEQLGTRLCFSDLFSFSFKKEPKLAEIIFKKIELKLGHFNKSKAGKYKEEMEKMGENKGTSEKDTSKQSHKKDTGFKAEPKAEGGAEKKAEESKPEDELKKAFKARLVVGKIVSIEEHPDADKLFIEKISLGKGADSKERVIQVVSGLRPWYKKEELAGKKVIVVENLEPAKFRGIKSEAMLLAAENNGNVKVIFSDAEPGTKAFIAFSESLAFEAGKQGKISFKEFSKLRIEVRDKKASFVYNNKAYPLLLSSKPIELDLPDGSKIR